MDKLEELKAALFKDTPDEVKDQEQQESQVGFVAEELDSVDIGLASSTIDTITIDMSNWSGLSINSMNGPASIPAYTFKGAQGSSGSIFTTSGSNGSSWSTAPNPSCLQVTGDAEFDGDIKWKGRSLGTMIATIEERLSILQPDPAKLEKFEALKKAYEHYKLMEKLCYDDPKPTE